MKLSTYITNLIKEKEIQPSFFWSIPTESGSVQVVVLQDLIPTLDRLPASMRTSIRGALVQVDLTGGDVLEVLSVIAHQLTIEPSV